MCYLNGIESIPSYYRISYTVAAGCVCKITVYAGGRYYGSYRHGPFVTDMHLSLYVAKSSGYPDPTFYCENGSGSGGGGQKPRVETSTKISNTLPSNNNVLNDSNNTLYVEWNVLYNDDEEILSQNVYVKDSNGNIIYSTSVSSRNNVTIPLLDNIKKVGDKGFTVEVAVEIYNKTEQKKQTYKDSKTFNTNFTGGGSGGGSGGVSGEIKVYLEKEELGPTEKTNTVITEFPMGIYVYSQIYIAKVDMSVSCDSVVSYTKV